MESACLNVKDFTQSAIGHKVPDKPIIMDKDKVTFIARMVMSELSELYSTVSYYPVKELHDILGKLDISCKKVCNESEPKRLAEQADAFVDIIYYLLDTAVRHGINLAPIFDLVHTANMNKRFPDGEFHRREDGKVMKPPEWQEPDVTGEIQRQLKEGSWN